MVLTLPSAGRSHQEPELWIPQTPGPHLTSRSVRRRYGRSEGAQRRLETVMTTGFLWDELYAWHDTGTGAGFLSAGGLVEPEVHGESAATKRRLRNLLDVSGLGGQMTQLRGAPGA